MILPETALATLVTIALVACSISPIVLLILFFREWKKDTLW